MSHELLIHLAAILALTGLAAYAVFGGADFGGGVWDLFAFGPRRDAQRAAIAHAMGPVWEANHVWLIFVVVVLFTCFPYGYAPLGIALFIPFHLALIGIMLRGAAFIFRGYRSQATGRPSRWGAVFGVTSLISPFLLGMAFGVVTEGGVHVNPGGGVTMRPASLFLEPYTLACGFLALSTCAYLAAVYLTVETTGELRDDFRGHAILSGTTTAMLAALVLFLAHDRADWFFRQITAPRAWPILAVGGLMFAASAWAVFGRRHRLSRFFAAGQVVLMLAGWGVAQRPYLIYPDVTIYDAAAPRATIAFLLASFPFGAVFLIPSLWLLFRVFKTTERATNASEVSARPH
ncbi:cytochrome d ubiquinol oxidase subunit II [Tundrisphaera sp. TA3]|uniref:cytochrome d ubiquinol oxidase subunit II n=1 Tax=Tundrisphaera sp. TA3 TaxID=3435775 RepID=UPI003EBE7308